VPPTVLAQSKQRFACIVARRDAEQTPLVPSRLLFTGPDDETIARASQWAKGSASIAPIPASGPDRTSPFEVPRPINACRKVHITGCEIFLHHPKDGGSS